MEGNKKNDAGEHYMRGPSGEAAEQSLMQSQPLLGDKPGDVVTITLAPPIGVPLALPDGRIMLWSATGDLNGQRAVARFSEDHGVTWSEPRVLFAFPRDKGEFGGGACLVSQNGTIHLFGLDYYGFNFQQREESKSYLWHARSLDAGESWEPVQWVDFGLTYTGATNNAFQLRSGRIIVPVSGLSDRRTGVWVSLAPYSDDDGATWNPQREQIAISTGASDWYESGAAEPVGIELKDGQVWLLPRSQDGYHWETFSRDGSLHWSPPRHTRFVCNQSAMAVLRLRDGRIVLFWNNCGAEGLGEVHWGNAERAVMAAALSRDEGKTWTGYREIGRVTTSAQISYPYVTQASDGTLLLSAAGTLRKINPEFLTNTTLREDFSDGIRRWSTLAAEGVSAAPDPDGSTHTVLHMQKPKENMPSGACMNFPYGTSGTLSIRLMIERGFQGAHFTLTDHFDLPGLPRDGCFPFRILPSGRIEIIGSGGSWLATPGDLIFGTGHEMRLEWNCAATSAMLFLDGAEIARIEQYVYAPGVCYVRLRSLAEATDENGLYVRSIQVEVAS